MCYGYRSAPLQASRSSGSGSVGVKLLRFADGTTGRVYRETVVDHDCVADPCVLVVCFSVCGFVRGPFHTLFVGESMLNTPLFVGFPGFVSKLWLASDDNGVYRGVYGWDGANQPSTSRDASGTFLPWSRHGSHCVCHRQRCSRDDVLVRTDRLADRGRTKCGAGRSSKWTTAAYLSQALPDTASTEQQPSSRRLGTLSALPRTGSQTRSSSRTQCRSSQRSVPLGNRLDALRPCLSSSVEPDACSLRRRRYPQHATFSSSEISPTTSPFLTGCPSIARSSW